ncbi:MAG TPA: SDR family oxidoreductase [Methylophaga aminisulfidivorans]|nr:SDR family oxidoreductase [Methylophaga sp.]HIM39786.1 SDR family oxidoreductase [Methylophaga aminisulfidivorans]
MISVNSPEEIIKMKKLVLVTGGSRGLGRETALYIADKGCDVIITYNKNKAAAEEVVNVIQEKGRAATAIALDVSQSSTFKTFADAVKTQLGTAFESNQLDVIIHNAGIGIHKSFEDTTESDFDTLMNIHLKAPFFLTQSLLAMIAPQGQIIHISSGLARFSLPGYAAYAMMKGGVEVLTRYLAKELGTKQIRVNTLAPGAIETDFGGGIVRDNAELNRSIANQTALGRVGLPDDIAKAMAMLISDDSAWVNGQRIEASGGMFL